MSYATEESREISVYCVQFPSIGKLVHTEYEQNPEQGTRNEQLLVETQMKYIQVPLLADIQALNRRHVNRPRSADA